MCRDPWQFALAGAVGCRVVRVGALVAAGKVLWRLGAVLPHAGRGWVAAGSVMRAGAVAVERSILPHVGWLVGRIMWRLGEAPCQQGRWQSSAAHCRMRVG
jgi:hypothetical protein